MLQHKDSYVNFMKQRLTFWLVQIKFSGFIVEYKFNLIFWNKAWLSGWYK